MLLVLLALAGLSFGVCPTGPTMPSVEIGARTVDKEGPLYRRADVLIFVPVEKRLLMRTEKRLRSEAKISRLSEELFRVELRVKNVSSSIVSGSYVEQPLVEHSEILGRIKGHKIISRLPLILEPVSLFPTDLSDGKAVIKLPPLKPGEVLEIAYTVSGPPEAPTVRRGGTYTVSSEDRVYVLVGKYSFLFGFAKTSTEDPNVHNLREVIEGLSKEGLKPLIRIIGVADGRSSDLRRNMSVANARARFVAMKLLGESWACYVRKVFAGNIK